ncbi:MAG TPA: hypothetical protein VF331_18435 [Polyangiales bacterium]
MRRAASLCSIFLLACLVLTSSACNLNNPGDDPPRGLLYFPTALALSGQSSSAAPRFLYLINSNFDLRYNGGSVQAYDLAALDKQIARQCASAPGIDCKIDPTSFLVDEVLVSSFATGVAPSGDHKHLYMTNRADASLTFIETDETVDVKKNADGLLRCGNTGRHCDPDHQRGDPLQNPRNLSYPPEGIALATGNARDLLEPDQTADPNAGKLKGDFVLVAHRGGQVSLFLEQAESGQTLGPTLVDVVTGLVQEPTAIAFDHRTRRAYFSVHDRLTAAGSGPKVLGRVGVALNLGATQQSALYDDGILDIDGVSATLDTRSLAFTDELPGQALVISRNPAALLWVDVPQIQTSDVGNAVSAPARRTVLVGAGPSRLTLGHVAGRSVVVVSCFDAREIYVIDLLDGEVLSIVHNLSGPFELGIDDVRKRLYVADFRSSVVRILDLAPVVQGAHAGPTSAEVIATLGSPRPVQEFK